MKEWLSVITEHAIVVIDALALLIIVVGTLEAFANGLRTMLGSAAGHEKRDVWLRYARWLVAGLTFQLAADIIETSITTSWEAIGRLAAIAVIRTFLNYWNATSRRCASGSASRNAARANPKRRPAAHSTSAGTVSTSSSNYALGAPDSPRTRSWGPVCYGRAITASRSSTYPTTATRP